MSSSGSNSLINNGLFNKLLVKDIYSEQINNTLSQNDWLGSYEGQFLSDETTNVPLTIDISNDSSSNMIKITYDNITLPPFELSIYNKSYANGCTSIGDDSNGQYNPWGIPFKKLICNLYKNSINSNINLQICYIGLDKSTSPQKIETLKNLSDAMVGNLGDSKLFTLDLFIKINKTITN